MFEPLEGLPEGVIGFRASGKIEASDYTDVLVPAIDKAAEAGGFHLVLVFDSFDGYSAGTGWEDLKMGIHHLKHWERTALVTDIEWMTHLVTLSRLDDPRATTSPSPNRRPPSAGRPAARPPSRP